MAARLACPYGTAVRLFLAPCPSAEHWRPEVQALGCRLGLEPAALADLLVEAEALHVRPYRPVDAVGGTSGQHHWEHH